MKLTRTLYALAAVAFATPALAADVSYRDASNEKIAATSSESAVADHPREAWADRDGKLLCRCMPAQEQKKGDATRSPEPYSADFTDQG